MTASPGLTRAVLAERTLEVLNRGNWGNPDVLRVRSDVGDAVVKDFAPRAAWVRLTLGRLITRREVAAYRALADHPNVPRFLGSIDALAFAVEYRPGRPFSSRLYTELPLEFARDLERAVDAMHARGVTHLDLSHRSNLMVDERGAPVLIDFASAICLRPGGVLCRLLLPILRLVDQRALRKWRKRLERADAWRRSRELSRSPPSSPTPRE